VNLRERKFLGYERADGSVGVRNVVGVIYTVDCARIVSETIAASIPNGTAVGWYSCFSTEDTHDINTLVGIAKNPNVGSSIVIGLGCQHISPADVAREIRKTGKEAEILTIQGIGGTRKTIEKGVKIATRMSAELQKLKRTENELSKLTVGMKLDGSGHSAKILRKLMSAVGNELSERGGKVLVGDNLGHPTLSERELPKLGPGIYPREKGWYLVDGLTARNVRHFGLEADGEPTDLAASGAQILLRGVETGFVGGNVVSPLIKVCGDSRIFRKMEDDIDFNADEGKEEGQLKESLLKLILDTASGRETKSERLGHKEGGIIFGGRPLLKLPAQVCE